jgi:hypothetical protein
MAMLRSVTRSASSMSATKMTKAETLEMWRSEYLPAVRARYETDGRADYPARSESWNELTDALCKEGSISLRQYETWRAPRECGK